MKKIFFQGAFDILNWGHVKAIQEASKHGDYLIIGLNTDELYEEYRGYKPILPYDQKKEILENIKGVDEVIPINVFSCLSALEEKHIDVYVLEEKWEGIHSKEINFIENKGGKIVYTPRYKGAISTSDIKKELLRRAKNETK